MDQVYLFLVIALYYTWYMVFSVVIARKKQINYNMLWSTFSLKNVVLARFLPGSRFFRAGRARGGVKGRGLSKYLERAIRTLLLFGCQLRTATGVWPG